MNEYELTVLIHPDLESTLDSALDKVRTDDLPDGAAAALSGRGFHPDSQPDIPFQRPCRAVWNTGFAVAPFLTRTLYYFCKWKVT